MKYLAGKILYGLLFCLVLPILLLCWAYFTNDEIKLPMGAWEIPGTILSIIGFTIMIWAMYSLNYYGKGLPMNAYPPIHYVSKGAYSIFKHPIYTGFCLLCAGFSLFFHSPSGLYLVTPVITLLCFTLLIGYEVKATQNLFGKKHHESIFGIPENKNETVSFLKRCFIAFEIFFIWILLYEMLIYFGTNHLFIDSGFSFEKHFPVIQFMEVFYVFTYPFVFLVPFFARTKKQLRYFVKGSFWIIALGIFFQTILPFSFEPRAFTSTGLFGNMINWERSTDGPAAALPSFHVIWAFFAASCYAYFFPKNKKIFYVIASLISISCVATAAHSISDVITGYFIFLCIDKRKYIWNAMQKISEYFANSWKEWHLGSFRVINHSLYAGLACATGLLILIFFLNNSLALFIICFSSLVGAALWGQFVEGSSHLLRPFGYYGSIIGFLFGMFICNIFLGIPIILSCAACSLAAPWVQSIGRIRCLVQGCCHGSETSDGNGIRYVNEHSRVCKISDLKGKTLHNTQLYSILWNAATGLFLARLYYGGVSLSLLSGLYLILNGTGRFAEEAYRGEVQTKIIGGLRFYQWMAILCIASGAIITTIHSDIQMPFKFSINTSMIIVIIISSLFSSFALGMDFPKSNFRFSRLSG